MTAERSPRSSLQAPPYAGRTPAIGRIVWLCVAVTFIEPVFYGVLAPLLPRFTHEFGFSKQGAGLLVASYMVGMLGAMAPLRRLLGRVAPRLAVIAGLLVMAGATTTFALADSAPALVIIRGVQGFGAGIAWLAALGWLLDIVPEPDRGRILGKSLATTFVGSALGPLVGALVLAVGALPTLLTVSIFGVALSLAAARMPGEMPPRRAAAPAAATALLTRPGLAILALLTAVSMGTGARFVLIPLQLSAEGVGGRGIAFTFAGVAIVMAACALLTGRVVDRRGTTAPMLIGAAVSVVLLLGLSRTNTALSTALVAVSIGFGLQPTATAAILRLTAMSDRLGVDSGTSLSYVNLCWTGGYLVGSLTAGWVSQRASDAAAWVVLACVCAAAGALFAFTR